MTADTGECTHEMFEWGLCIGCGTKDDRDAEEVSPPLGSGCQNRGWYHDGSEQEEAARKGRPLWRKV